LGLAATRAGVALTDEGALCDLIPKLKIRFEPGPAGEPARVFLEDRDISDTVRTEATGHLASQVAVLPGVRAALLDLQRAFRRPPGLVTDGRDMGTTVFPDAFLKVYLTASAAVRAERRYKQLKEKGLEATLGAVLGEISQRDARDAERSASPLKPAADAWILDTSSLSIDEVVEAIHQRLRERLAS
jgi:cytidylate kinase